MQLFLSLEFGTLVFVPSVLFWQLVLGFCSYIVIGNDDFASKSSVSKAKDAERIRRK
jgi:hypothetical protein